MTVTDAAVDQMHDLVRILVVEDQQTLAEALVRVLDHEPDLNCIGHAGTGMHALRLATLERPDVAVVDVGLPDMDGIDLCRILRRTVPTLRVVVLTAEATPTAAARAAEAGATAFLPKNGGLDTVLSAVRATTHGHFAVDADILAAMLEGPKKNASGLTPREQQMLRLMTEGLDARAISRRLGLSLHTTRSYTKALYRKLDVHSQLEAVAVAMRTGQFDHRVS